MLLSVNCPFKKWNIKKQFCFALFFYEHFSPFLAGRLILEPRGAFRETLSRTGPAGVIFRWNEENVSKHEGIVQFAVIDNEDHGIEINSH